MGNQYLRNQTWTLILQQNGSWCTALGMREFEEVGWALCAVPLPAMRRVACLVGSQATRHPIRNFRSVPDS